jgi:hypothetical protein
VQTSSRKASKLASIKKDDKMKYHTAKLYRYIDPDTNEVYFEAVDGDYQDKDNCPVLTAGSLAYVLDWCYRHNYIV